MRKLLLMALIGLPLAAQQPVPPPTPPPLTKEVVFEEKPTDTSKQNELLKLEVAITKYQLVATQLQSQMDKQLGPQQQEISNLLAAARKSRGLDDTYQYDPARHLFVHSVPIVQPPPAESSAKK